MQSAWPVVRDSLLTTLKRKTLVIPLVLHSSDSDEFVLVDYAYTRPSGEVEYAVLKYERNGNHCGPKHASRRAHRSRPVAGCADSAASSVACVWLGAATSGARRVPVPIVGIPSLSVWILVM